MENLRKKLRNARVSFRALYVLWRESYSFRALVISACIAILASIVLRISMLEFLILILAIGAVLSVETLNTAIEEVCNHVTPEHHPQIGKIKDLASGALGIIGVAAVVIGCTIFVPHLLALL